MTYNEQADFVRTKLAGSENDWHLKVFELILKIKPGELISYDDLARWSNKEHGLTQGPRNMAQLRMRVYQLFGTNGQGIDLPVHRVANEGDLNSTFDHPETQEINRLKRSIEGSFQNPVWLKK